MAEINFSLKIDKAIQKQLGLTMSAKDNKATYKKTKPELFKNIRKEFSLKGPTKVKQSIIQDTLRGISPVKGKGKFTKYSGSYKAAIRNEALRDSDGNYYIYRMVNGRRLKIKVKKKKLSGRNYVQEQSGGMKRVSPITLRLSGELHRSLKATVKGGFWRASRLVIVWDHYLADIHNRQGAGKSKVVRRMLPTNTGERFNRTIEATLFNEWNLSTIRVLRKWGLIK